MGALGSATSTNKNSKYQGHLAMSRLKSNKGARRNVASPYNNSLHFPILRTPAIPLISYGIILAVACFSCLYAQPYKGHLNDLSWGKYAAPSPMELLEESSHDYETQPTDMEPSEGIIEENPPTNHKSDNLPNNYEELDSMFGSDNNLQPSKIPQRAPQESGHEYLDPSPSEVLPKENDPGTQGKLNPASMTSKQLAGFLSQFYLIRTPYGYILGRHNPTSSTTSISRRSMQPPKPRLKDHYDVGSPDEAERSLHANFKLRVRKNLPNFQLRLKRNPNFQLRLRRASPNFQLRVRKSPNFQLRVRKSPNFQLRVRKNPNFQLRVRKSDPGNAFQLIVRKNEDEGTIRQSRNFQLRVRKSDPYNEGLNSGDESNSGDRNIITDEITRIVRNPSAFQLRVRKSPRSSFQLRVRKDGSSSPRPEEEEEYLEHLNEDELESYANDLPEIELPGFLKAAKRARNFQLRV